MKLLKSSMADIFGVAELRYSDKSETILKSVSTNQGSHISEEMFIRDVGGGCVEDKTEKNTQCASSISKKNLSTKYNLCLHIYIG
jgi:hypothetical protein